MRLVVILFSFLLTTPLAAATIFTEADGLLVIEAEATGSPLGKWELRTDIPGYSGAGHLHFTGNREMSGSKNSPLKYPFTIAIGGTYRLVIRGGRNAPDGTPGDQANDCYVKVEGNYAAGGKAPLEVLQADTKMFGAKEDSWDSWTMLMDHQHNKFNAEYVFEAGGQYLLTIHGRSRSYNFDRLVFFKTDAHSLKDAKAAVAAAP